MDMTTNDTPPLHRNTEGLEVGDPIGEANQLGRLHCSRKEVHQDEIPLAPAYFAGRQKGTENVADFDLYILTEEIPGNVQWSTVSGRTLKAAGFRLPPCIPNPAHERVLVQIRRLWQGSRHDDVEESRLRDSHVNITSDLSPIVFPVIRKG